MNKSTELMFYLAVSVYSIYREVAYGEPFVSKWRYKIPSVGVPNWKDKSTRCVLSTRFYRLHLVRIDSMCFINSIWRLLLVRIDSIPGRGKREFRGRPDMAVVAAL